MRWPYIFVRSLLLAMALVNCHRRKKGELSEYYYSYEIHDTPIRSDSYQSSDEIEEDIFDLQGDLLKKFVFEVASLGPNESLVCSPLSALLPLGKLAFGARGKTLAEILKAIGVETKSEVSQRLRRILNNMRRMHGVTLSVASRLYLNKEKELSPKFTDTIKEVFKFSAELVDMRYPEKVVQKINYWVKAQTNGAITDILRPDDLSSSMILILVNAVHFKGIWKYPFRNVEPAIFYGSEGERVLPMMKITDHFNYGVSKTLDAKIINIPYNESLASFLVVLPNSRTGLSLLLKELRLAPTLLNTIKMKRKLVNLKLPEFKIVTDINLKLLYKKIGLKEIFSKQTGFDYIIDDEKVVVDHAKQKAVIEVTAEGTEAGAASVVEGIQISLNNAPENFEAEHPFLFFIMSKKQQIFAGIFTAA